MAEHKLRALVSGLTPFFFNKSKDNTIEGHTYPKEASTIDLGSATKPFRAIYADTLVGSGGGGGGETVKVSAADPTAGYLEDKIAATSPLSLATSTDSLLNLSLNTSTLLLRSGANSLQGNLSVDSGVTIDGVDIGNPSNGLEIVSNRYAINLATNAGLTFNTGELVVNPASTLTLSANALGVNQAATFTWTGQHQFNVAPDINANLDFIGGNRTITATNNLTIDPDDDLIFDTGGINIFSTGQDIRTSTFNDFVAGIEGFRNQDAGGNFRQLTIGRIKADELYVRVFTADEARVNRGEEFWSRSYGIVEETFTIPADEANVDVWFEEAPGLSGGKLFLPNNWILFRTVDVGTGLTVMRVWFQVVDAGANDYITREDVDNANGQMARQQWRLKRKFGGTTGATIEKGNVAVDFGLPADFSGTPLTGQFKGQGVVHLSALHQDNGPFVQIQTFDTVVSDNPQFANRVRMGNLNGTVDYTTDIFGFATGNNLADTPSTGFKGMVADETNGLRMFNTDIYLYDGSTLSATLQTEFGLAFLTDDTIFSHDERVIAWYDDLDDIGSAYSTGKISVTGDSDTSVMHLSTFSTDVAAIFINAVGDGGADGASLSVKSMWDSITGGLIDVTAEYFRMLTDTPRFRIGGDTSQLAVANLHLYYDSTAINDTAGFTIEQDGTGDPVIHWSLSLGQMFTAGIDNSDGDKWKLSAGTSLGPTDYIIINPSDGSVIINGLDLSGGTGITGLIGGDGIDVAGSTISVDTTVVRTDRTITAGDGLSGGGDLSSNKTIDVDSSVVRTTRSISTSGALAGGGNLSADRTLTLTLATNSGLNQTSGLAVDSSLAGTGLTLTTGVLSVNTASGITTSGDNIILASSAAGAGLAYTTGVLSVNTSSGLTISGDNVILDSNVAGTGLTYTTGVLSVNAGNGLTTSGDNIIVNLGYAFSWTAQHSFNTDIQLDANLDFVGAQSITTTTGNLTITPVGDLVLDPGDQDVLPGGSIQIDLGDYNRKWRTLHAAELYVETLVAQDVLATIGGRIMVAPTTSLVTDINTSVTTITVKHNGVFAVNDYAMMQTAPGGVAQFEVIKITASLGAGGGGYQYTVTRNSDGTGANSWVAGDAIVSLGNAVGDGYIDLTSTSTVHNHFGPTITIYSRTATTNWDDVAPVVSMGNLESFVDYSTDTFGFAVGNDLTLDAASGFSGITADAENGLRLFNVDFNLYESTDLVTTIDTTTGISFLIDVSDTFGSNLNRYIKWYSDLDPLGTVRSSVRAWEDVHNQIGLFSYARSGVDGISSLIAIGGGDTGSISARANHSGDTSITADADELHLKGLHIYDDYAEWFNLDTLTAYVSDGISFSNSSYGETYQFTIGDISGGVTDPILRTTHSGAARYTMVARRSGGTVVSPTEIIEGQTIMSFGGVGYSDLDWETPVTGEISLRAVRDFDGTHDYPAEWVFLNRYDGAYLQMLSINPFEGLIVGENGGSDAQIVFRTSLADVVAGMSVNYDGDFMINLGSDLDPGAQIKIDSGTGNLILGHYTIFNGGTSFVEDATFDGTVTFASTIIGPGGSGDVHPSATGGSGITVTSGQVVSVDLGTDSGLDVVVSGLVIDLATNSGLNTTAGLAVDSSIAGDGLSMTSGVLNVNALSTGGLQVNTNNIQILLPGTSGLTTDATGLYIADSIAGAGLAIASKVLAVGAGAGITVNANDIEVHLNATSGLEISSGLRIADTVAGAGLVIASKVLAVGAGDGITVNANDVQVDTTVVRTTRDLIAGAGLTGGGTLSADRTFAVGAGAGITVNADDVAINLATNSGLNVGAGLAVDSSLAGAGMTLTSGVLNVIALSTGGLTVNANDIQIKLPANSGLTTDSTGLYLPSSLAGTGLSLTAGVLSVNVTDGLTTSGDNIILASSAAGTGLAYASGVLSVNTSSGLTTSGDNVILASTVAGAGLTYTTGVLDIVAANTSITVNADSINVNLAHTFAWTGSHTWSTGVFTFNTDPQINSNLDFIGGARSITTASSDNLTITPGGDLVLSPGGLDVLPGSSMTIDLGDYNRKWLTLYAAELYVETLVAQDVMATIGGRIMVAPTTTLVADMTNVQTTINVKHNNLVNGSYIRLQAAPGGVAQIEVMKVTSAVSGTAGNYTYTVTRNLDGSGANTWSSGDAVVDIGSAVGNGYIELSSTSTIHSHIGPTITIYSRTATTNWNDTKAVVTMGNLSSFVDYSGDEFGFAVGNDLTLDASTGFSGITADRTDGVRLFNVDLDLFDGSDRAVAINKDDGITFKYGATTGGYIPTNFGLTWLDDIETPSTDFGSSIHSWKTLNDTYLYMSVKSVTGTPSLRLAAYKDASHNSSLGLDSDVVYIENLGAYWKFFPTGNMLAGGGFGTVVSSRLHVWESTTTNNSATGVTIENFNGTGDSMLHFVHTNGVTQRWTLGTDRSDSNKFKISETAGFGSLNHLTITPSTGLINIAGDLTMANATTLTAETIRAVDTSGIIFKVSGGTTYMTLLNTGVLQLVDGLTVGAGLTVTSTLTANAGITMLSGQTLTTEIIKAVDATGLIFQDDSATAYMYMEDGGNVGIGSAASNPATTLHVEGNSLWVNGTGASGLASSAGSGIRISSANIFSYNYTTGTPNTLTLQSPGGAVAITGAATVGGTLDVTGATGLSSLAVSSTSTLTGNVIFTGAGIIRTPNANGLTLIAGTSTTEGPYIQLYGKDNGGASDGLTEFVGSTESSAVGGWKWFNYNGTTYTEVAAMTSAGALQIDGLLTASGGINVGEDDLTVYSNDVSWTPTITSTGTAPTYVATAVGRYTRVNNLVTIQASITITSVSAAGTGSYRFSLPVTAARSQSFSGFANGLAGAGDEILVGLSGNTAYISILGSINGVLGAGDIGASDTIYYSGSYYV